MLFGRAGPCPDALWNDLRGLVIEEDSAETRCSFAVRRCLMRHQELLSLSCTADLLGAPAMAAESGPRGPMPADFEWRLDLGDEWSSRIS